MKLAIYGIGGVGGYFGGRLATAGAEVHLIARGAHLDALRTRGLKVHSSKGDLQLTLPATDEPSDVGVCDYVLFCVKAFDTDTAARRLAPLVGLRSSRGRGSPPSQRHGESACKICRGPRGDWLFIAL